VEHFVTLSQLKHTTGWECSSVVDSLAIIVQGLGFGPQYVGGRTHTNHIIITFLTISDKELLASSQRKEDIMCRGIKIRKADCSLGIMQI
jgi:hypothetical protein